MPYMGCHDVTLSHESPLGLCTCMSKYAMPDSPSVPFHAAKIAYAYAVKLMSSVLVPAMGVANSYAPPGMVGEPSATAVMTGAVRSTRTGRNTGASALAEMAVQPGGVAMLHAATLAYTSVLCCSARVDHAAQLTSPLSECGAAMSVPLGVVPNHTCTAPSPLWGS